MIFIECSKPIHVFLRAMAIKGKAINLLMEAWGDSQWRYGAWETVLLGSLLTCTTVTVYSFVGVACPCYRSLGCAGNYALRASRLAGLRD